MPPRLPPLDEKTLLRLRGLMRNLHAQDARAVPLGDLMSVAGQLSPEVGLTIDLEASRELGHPMVVLRVPPTAQSDERLLRLSRREREIVALIAEGLANKQIAQRLHLALATVKDHVHRILEKTGLANRAAVAAVYRSAHPAI